MWIHPRSMRRTILEAVAISVVLVLVALALGALIGTLVSE